MVAKYDPQEVLCDERYSYHQKLFHGAAKYDPHIHLIQCTRNLSFPEVLCNEGYIAIIENSFMIESNNVPQIHLI